MTLINCQQTITPFIEKLDLFIHNLSKGIYYQFPELISIKDDIATADAQRYIDHVNDFKRDFECRFVNVLAMEICDWMINPFTVMVNKADVTCQEELLQVRHDEESKNNFHSGGYMQHWQN